jgi:hypothetical protein
MMKSWSAKESRSCCGSPVVPRRVASRTSCEVSAAGTALDCEATTTAIARARNAALIGLVLLIWRASAAGRKTLTRQSCGACAPIVAFAGRDVRLNGLQSSMAAPLGRRGPGQELMDGQGDKSDGGALLSRRADGHTPFSVLTCCLSFKHLANQVRHVVGPTAWGVVAARNRLPNLGRRRRDWRTAITLQRGLTSQWPAFRRQFCNSPAGECVDRRLVPDRATV